MIPLILPSLQNGHFVLGIKAQYSQLAGPISSLYMDGSAMSLMDTTEADGEVVRDDTAVIAGWTPKFRLPENAVAANTTLATLDIFILDLGK